MKPLFVVISAPSGAGKTTLCDLLLQTYPEFCYSVSCTTRYPRFGEEDGIDYHFLPNETFERFIKEEKFLEYALVHDNYYGTLKQPIYDVLNERQSMLLDIDVKGAAQVRKHIAGLPQSDPLRSGFVDIFISPPSMEELRRRLETRGTDAPEVIEKRLLNAQEEMSHSGEYMYQVVNDQLEIALRQLCDIINVKGQII
jgi:guanylate kinase